MPAAQPELLPVAPAAPPDLLPADDTGEAVTSLLDALAGPRVSHGLRVHAVRADGSRGEMLFTAGASDHPDEIRGRIARRWGAGEYELAPIRDGRYHGQPRRMVIEAAASTAPPAPVAAPVPAIPDLGSLVTAMGAQTRELMQSMQSQMMEMQLRASESQLALMREVVGARGGQGGGGVSDRLFDLLAARALDDPTERLLKLLNINRELREDAAPPDRTGEMLAGLATALGGVVAASMSQGAPAPGAPAAPAAAAGLPAQWVPALQSLVRLAERGADPLQVVAVLGALLDAEELAQAVMIMGNDQARGALLASMPALQPHAAWLASTAKALSELDDESEAAGHGAADPGR